MATRAVTMLLAVLLAGAVTAGKDKWALRERMDLAFSWKYMDYALPSAEVREQLIASGWFIPRRCMAVGMEVWRDRLFITTPRRKAGVPVALGYVHINDTDQSPLIIPYPDYETNRLPEQGEQQPVDKAAVHITSAYRIKVDACDRLWVIDTGLADIGAGHGQYSPPQLLVFDLRSDSLLRRYPLRADDYQPSSFFASVGVEADAAHCHDAYAYLTDLGAGGLVVYSFRDNRSWRVTHSYFSADPLASSFEFGQLRFQQQDGVIAAAVTGPQANGSRTLYFHPLSSFNEFSVSTNLLHEENPPPGSHLQFAHLGRRGQRAQSSSSAFHERTGVLFFAEVQTHAVTCWNTRCHPRCVNRHVHVVARDAQTEAFVYPCDIKVDPEDNLWVLSNQMFSYVFGELNPKEYNIFVFKTPVSKALEGTRCAASPSGHWRSGHHNSEGDDSDR